MNVHEYVNLGDNLTEIMDWDGAESMYLSARNLASRLHYIEGRTLAIESLNTLYGLRQQDIDEQRLIAQGLAQDELAAADFIIEGDNALLNGDNVAAAVFFQLARDKYSELENDAVVASIDRRMALVNVSAWTALFAPLAWQTGHQ